MKDDLRGSQKLSKIKSKTEERVQISTEEAKSKEKQHDLKTKVTSKYGSFTLNEKAAIQKKKIKSCKDQSLVVKMEKGNNLRIYCSTTEFEKIRRQIVRHKRIQT